MCSRSGRIPLMVTLGTHTPAGGLRDMHGPATQSHGPTLRDLRNGGMHCVIDLLKGASVARSGAERFHPLLWRWHLSLILRALQRVHDITRRTADGHSSAHSTGVLLKARRPTLTGATTQGRVVSGHHFGVDSLPDDFHRSSLVCADLGTPLMPSTTPIYGHAL